MLLGQSAAIWLAWLLGLAFFGAGVVNAMGTPAVKAGFVRWGYPRWWNVLTGGLEMLAAGLIALPTARIAGVGLGASICVAAVATVVWHKDWRHLPPAATLTALSALDLMMLAN
ncbi:MAG: hypothetical protein E8A49_12630 [Phenylobacterium sp.]|nr:MAG: hypothetical protein E8A49_12630 [Phenylobacterium sp.]